MNETLASERVKKQIFGHLDFLGPAILAENDLQNYFVKRDEGNSELERVKIKSLAIWPFLCCCLFYAGHLEFYMLGI